MPGDQVARAVGAVVVDDEHVCVGGGRASAGRAASSMFSASSYVGTTISVRGGQWCHDVAPSVTSQRWWALLWFQVTSGNQHRSR